jgi:hypothetical protein
MRIGGYYEIPGEAWIGQAPGEQPPESQAMTLTTTQNVNDPMTFEFVLDDAPQDATVNYGDGETETIAQTPSSVFFHQYTNVDTFHVTVHAGPAFAEAYVNPTAPAATVET